MPTLTEAEITGLLAPYASVIDNPVLSKLSLYLDLLLKWNARTNLTAIREPKTMVSRHFGESLFAAQYVSQDADTLLDFGSGAGFPGIPIALWRPDVRVTLAESQNKKATFLREVVRTMGLSVEIWAARVETMPELRSFHTVTLRAVDNMASALESAVPRASKEIMILGSSELPPVEGFVIHPSLPIPTTRNGVLIRAMRG